MPATKNGVIVTSVPHESLRRPVASGTLALACVALGAALLAQGSGASIGGVVKDSSGAVLPGVTVMVTSPALGQRVLATVTNGSGQYRIVALPPGTYALTATLTGFSTFERIDLEVSGAGIITVNPELKAPAIGIMVPLARERVMSVEVLDALPTRLSQSSQFCQSLFGANYLLDKMQTIEGELLRVMVRDGQTFMHIAVQEQAGVVQLWSVRWGRSALSNRPASFLRPGDRVIVAGHPGRNSEAHRLLLLTIALPNHGWKWGISSVGTGTCEIQLGVLVPGGR